MRVKIAIFAIQMNGVMKVFIIGVVWMLSLLGVHSVIAQQIVPFFQPLSWEQASMLAARENKLVLVELGDAKQFREKKLLEQRELLHYLQRNVIAIRMSLEDLYRQGVHAHLLMYEPPMYAYFMPYGDLLEWVEPERVANDPTVLRLSFEKAKEFATLKKRNSRSIHFEPLTFEMGLAKAEKMGRPLAVYVSAQQHQPSLLLEKNVLNLDEVADCYNQSFINVQHNWDEEFARKYAIQELPVMVFLNGQGKVIYQTSRLAEKSQLIEAAEVALKRVKGLVFSSFSREEALNRARMEQKMLFVHHYREGNAYQSLLRTVFADPDVVHFFERHFVNLAVPSEQNDIVFVDSLGIEVHRVLGEWTMEELLEEAKAVVNGAGLQGLTRHYEEGERNTEFLERYMYVLKRAGLSVQAAQVAMVYFQNMAPECLLQPAYWRLFELYALDVNSEQFRYMLCHREKFYALYGEAVVQQKEQVIWHAGADFFVQKQPFDESGFKSYIKRLKKEKVKNWRSIERGARMQLAQKSGNWKTFLSLGEEKWNAERVSDVELYQWGRLIYDHCQDENLRSKMAYWLSQRAFELEHQERTRGKSTITSYRGYIEKLVNDLLNK